MPTPTSLWSHIACRAYAHISLQFSLHILINADFLTCSGDDLTVDMSSDVVNFLALTKLNVKYLPIPVSYQTKKLLWFLITSLACCLQAYCKCDSEFPYPIISDKSRDIAVLLGMVDPNEKDKAGLPMTCRAVSLVTRKCEFTNLISLSSLVVIWTSL